MSRLDAAYELVSLGSVSRNEAAIVSLVERKLRSADFLDVERIGDNVIARTNGHRATRLIVAGHIDTVPGDASETVIDGEVLRGVGASDMKGSVAVMLELAVDPTPRSVEVTWIFYAREEIARSESGLVEIAELRPDLLQGDVAILGEPSGGRVEAGCQGTLRATVTLRGERAHTARPFTGRNAIHRMGDVLQRVSSYEPRVVALDGVTYTEQLQAVGVEGGVAANVVPDLCVLSLNHRVAPDRTKSDAEQWLRGFIADLIEDGDEFVVADWAPSALPSLTNERLKQLVGLTGKDAIGKVGWTDVASFQELNIPSTNFGAGDPLRAHKSNEYVTLEELDEYARTLALWLA